MREGRAAPQASSASPRAPSRRDRPLTEGQGGRDRLGRASSLGRLFPAARWVSGAVSHSTVGAQRTASAGGGRSRCPERSVAAPPGGRSPAPSAPCRGRRSPPGRRLPRSCSGLAAARSAPDRHQHPQTTPEPFTFLSCPWQRKRSSRQTLHLCLSFKIPLNSFRFLTKHLNYPHWRQKFSDNSRETAQPLSSNNCSLG